MNGELLSPCREAAQFNSRGAEDAGFALLFQVARYWSGASETRRRPDRPDEAPGADEFGSATARGSGHDTDSSPFTGTDNGNRGGGRGKH